MKKCFKCKIEKEIGSFYRHPATKDGTLGKCIDCTKEYAENYKNKNIDKYNKYHKEYRNTHVNQQKNYDLMKKFGITLAQFNEMFEQQEGKCLICKDHSSKFKKGLCVDHCHKTNKIRGLLCGNCNSAIGKLKEDPKIFAIALDYLEKNL